MVFLEIGLLKMFAIFYKAVLVTKVWIRGSFFNSSYAPIVSAMQIIFILVTA